MAHHSTAHITVKGQCAPSMDTADHATAHIDVWDQARPTLIQRSCIAAVLHDHRVPFPAVTAVTTSSS